MNSKNKLNLSIAIFVISVIIFLLGAGLFVYFFKDELGDLTNPTNQFFNALMMFILVLMMILGVVFSTLLLTSQSEKDELRKKKLETHLSKVSIVMIILTIILFIVIIVYFVPKLTRKNTLLHASSGQFGNRSMRFSNRSKGNSYSSKVKSRYIGPEVPPMFDNESKGNSYSSKVKSRYIGPEVPPMFDNESIEELDYYQNNRDPEDGNFPIYVTKTSDDGTIKYYKKRSPQIEQTVTHLGYDEIPKEEYLNATRLKVKHSIRMVF